MPENERDTLEKLFESYRVYKRAVIKILDGSGSSVDWLAALAARGERSRVEEVGYIREFRDPLAVIDNVSEDCLDSMLKLCKSMEAIAPIGLEKRYWRSCKLLVEHRCMPLEKIDPSRLAGAPATSELLMTEIIAPKIDALLVSSSIPELTTQVAESRRRASSAVTDDLKRFWAEIQRRTERQLSKLVLEQCMDIWRTSSPSTTRKSAFYRLIEYEIGSDELLFDEHTTEGIGRAPEFVARAIHSGSDSHYVDRTRAKFKQLYLSSAVAGYKFALLYPDLDDLETPRYETRSRRDGLCDLIFSAPRYANIIFQIPAESWSNGKFGSDKIISNFSHDILRLEFTLQRFANRH